MGQGQTEQRGELEPRKSEMRAGEPMASGVSVKMMDRDAEHGRAIGDGKAKMSM